MRYLIALCLIQLWTPAFGVGETKDSISGTILKGVENAVASAAETVKRVPLIGKMLEPCVEPPMECPNENVTFWVYERAKLDTPVQIKLGSDGLKGLTKNPNPWKVIIHGYTKSKDEIPNPELRSAYFEHGEYNLLSVDYSPIARDGCYIQSVHNVPLVANCTAQLIDSLIQAGYFKAENLHVIGFSLGAQIAGRMHEYMKQGKISRVTGLDPASPLFGGTVRNSLSKDAGAFVDVIHTNGLAKGKIARSGHADFYVNGGLVQPGCGTETDKSYSTCNHDRSPIYFAESINSPDGFWGIPCENGAKFMTGACNTEENNLVLMGEHIPYNTTGEFYLQTRDKPPYALGKRTSFAVIV